MKRVAALCLALLLLSSCAGMLEREHTVSQPHVEELPSRGDTAYRVETYPALRAALLSYVEEGLEEGVLHFPTSYAGNLTVDLERAKRQLMEEDPLGCYALEDITYVTSKIIAYYEVELTFSYRVGREDITSLTQIHSSDALSRLLAESIRREETQVCAYLYHDPDEEEGYFPAALDAAMEELGDAARPELSVQLYPRTGARRVAELTLTYPGEIPPEENPETGT